MARSKKDIDRELMYKKILPTAMAAEVGSAASPEKDVVEKEEVSGAHRLEVSIAQPVKVIMAAPELNGAGITTVDAEVTPAKKTDAEAEKEADDQGQASLSASDSAQSSKKELVLEPILVNLMEGFVEKRLDAALTKFKCCHCEKCRKDVLAMALNKLPPLYVIEDDADLRDLHERERAAQITTALVQAILIVKARPAHD